MRGPVICSLWMQNSDESFVLRSCKTTRKKDEHHLFLSASVDFSNVALFICNEAHFCRMLCLDYFVFGEKR